MGSFYTNITLRTADRSQVKAELAARGLSAFVSPPRDGALVVFEQSCEEQDVAVLRRVAADLASRFACAALAIMNHDDSVLLYTLFQGSRMMDEYNSAPDYFDDSESDTARGGDAAKLASAFGVSDRAALLAAALGAAGSDEGFVFETERHERIVEILGLPKCAIGTGYNYLEGGEIPEGYRAEDFELVSGP